MPSFRRFLLLSLLSFTTLHSTSSQDTENPADPVESEVGLIYPTPCPQYIQIINMYGSQQYGIPCCMTKDSICNNRYIPVCTPVPNCSGDNCYKTKVNLCHACTDPDVSVYIMGACPKKPDNSDETNETTSPSSSSTGGSKPSSSTTGSSSSGGGTKPSTSTGSSTSTGGTKPSTTSSGSSGGGGSKPPTSTGSSSGGGGGGKPSTSTTPTKPVKGPVKKTSIFVNKSSTSTRRIVKTPKKKSKKLRA